MTPEIHEAGIRYWHQDPLTPADGARKYSDFFSQDEFHRLELYQETARPLEVEYMMRLWLSPRASEERAWSSIAPALTSKNVIARCSTCCSRT